MKDIPNDIQKVINEGFSELLEPEKPEETQEELLKIIYREARYATKDEYKSSLKAILERFTIQRKKS